MAIVQCCLSFKIKVDVQGRITDELLFQEMLVSHFLHFKSGILVKKKKLSAHLLLHNNLRGGLISLLDWLASFLSASIKIQMTFLYTNTKSMYLVKFWHVLHFFLYCWTEPERFFFLLLLLLSSPRAELSSLLVMTPIHLREQNQSWYLSKQEGKGAPSLPTYFQGHFNSRISLHQRGLELPFHIINKVIIPFLF